MLVTRKAEFSASHVCRVPGLSDDENRELFGEGANPNGHGHNYVVEVTVEGEPDPVTGMVVDLKDLKEIIEREVVEPMDHRFLNYEVAPFDKVVPTTENVAREIWRRLEPRVATSTTSLARVRLFETQDLYVDVLRVDVVRGNNAK
jgi:6-pyruvoyltetrahydropterin/6-carboxytetrahydropterin synthase